MSNSARIKDWAPKHARLLTAMVKIMKNLLFYSIKWLLWGWYKSYMNLKITREALLAKYPWIEQMYHDIKSARARQKFRLVLPICCFRKSSFFFDKCIWSIFCEVSLKWDLFLCYIYFNFAGNTIEVTLRETPWVTT